MELSPQTNRLVVTSGKTVSFIPALPNGNQTLSLTLPYAPSSASIHPILQDRFVTGSTTDEWVRIHSLDGTEREVLKGHHGPVHCVEFSPDGEMFASGSGTSLPFLCSPGSHLSKRIPSTLFCTAQRTVRAAVQWALRQCDIHISDGRHYSIVADDTRESLRSLAGSSD